MWAAEVIRCLGQLSPEQQRGELAMLKLLAEGPQTSGETSRG